MGFFSKKIYPSAIGTSTPIKSCVIFVHGFLGGKKTWHTFSKHLFNEWTLNDSFGLEYDVHTIETRIPGWGFIKKLLTGGPGIDILAASFRTTIDTVCDEYDNVIIIAHSMGGLIARQYLVDIVKKDKDVGKVRALITYATPHMGSKLATYYKLLGIEFISFPFNRLSRQVNQMCRYNSSFIDKLNDDWRMFGLDQKVVFKRVIGELDFIVDRDSAAYNFSIYESIANKGHFDIIQPIEPKDPAFLITYKYLKNFRKEFEDALETEELNQLAEQEEDDEI